MFSFFLFSFFFLRKVVCGIIVMGKTYPVELSRWGLRREGVVQSRRKKIQGRSAKPAPSFMSGATWRCLFWEILQSLAVIPWILSQRADNLYGNPYLPQKISALLEGILMLGNSSTRKCELVRGRYCPDRNFPRKLRGQNLIEIFSNLVCKSMDW